jgi:alpha-N-acetylglucosamine transferase
MAVDTILFVLRKSKDYDVDYVKKLHYSILDNISRDVEICCISDVKLYDGITRLEFSNNWPGWWSKLEIFNQPYLKDRSVLYMDLDTVVNKNIDFLIDYDHKFTALKDFIREYYLASGILAWSGDYSFIPKSFRLDKHPKEYVTTPKWGDQAFIRDSLKARNIKPEFFQDLFPDKICSYKMLKDKSKRKLHNVICFHGRPRPREVNWRI